MPKINNEEFEMKTVSALYRSLTFSEDLLDTFDPTGEDVEAREDAQEFVKFMRGALREAYNKWMSEVN